MMKIKLPDVRNVLGWMLVEEMILLARVALNSGGLEGDLVEIGSYCGRSTVVIGDVLKQGVTGKLFAIDPHIHPSGKFKDGSNSLSKLKENLKA